MRRYGFAAAAWAAITGAALWAAADPAPAPIKAADLTKEFAKDESGMKAKYVGKQLLVEGKVVTVEVKPDAAAQISLAGHNETDARPIRVVCYFPIDLADEVKKVKKDATVKVTGEVGPGSSLLLKTVDLEKCSLAEPAP